MQRSSHILHPYVRVGTGAKKSMNDSDVACSRGGMKRTHADVAVRPVRVRSCGKEFRDDSVAAFLNRPVQDRSATVAPVRIDTALDGRAHRVYIARDAGSDHRFVWLED